MFSGEHRLVSIAFFVSSDRDDEDGHRPAQDLMVHRIGRLGQAGLNRAGEDQGELVAFRARGDVPVDAFGDLDQTQIAGSTLRDFRSKDGPYEREQHFCGELIQLHAGSFVDKACRHCSCSMETLEEP